jgi:hypothetical protein
MQSPFHVKIRMQLPRLTQNNFVDVNNDIVAVSFSHFRALGTITASYIIGNVSLRFSDCYTKTQEEEIIRVIKRKLQIGREETQTSLESKTNGLNSPGIMKQTTGNSDNKLIANRLKTFWHTNDHAGSKKMRVSQGELSDDREMRAKLWGM